MANYSHMTALHVLNSFFYLLIYPYVISAVGVEQYGSFVFGTSVASYFIMFVSFGFDIHAAKLVSLDANNRAVHAHLLSCVTIAKLLLQIAAAGVFLLLIIIFPIMRDNIYILLICFCNTFSAVFLPVWYFHGSQKMWIVTAVQLSAKIIGLPLIFLFVKTGSDIYIYAQIIVSTNIISGVVLFLIAMSVIVCRLPAPSVADIKKIILDVQPFFWSTAITSIKQRSVETLIGVLFGMKEVAIYDLANKIFSIPSILVSNINVALFPALVGRIQVEQVRKIIRYEIYLGVACILFVLFFGAWVVGLKFASELYDAYPISIILSINIMTILVVGGFIYFVFVPQHRYDLILKNQLVSIFSFSLACALFLLIRFNMYSIILALVVSAVAEIVYSSMQIRNLKKSNQIPSISTKI
ncbi:oligosaccharide flippase family protein [Castellaniella sp. FW104-16D08]|uniref:oligosaccharide flippase family protein n=1 Tax=Castellaniella sp. FW104-16D08 TaxID=3140377 RepID=UPI003316002A